MVQNPVPGSLRKESKKCSKILRDFENLIPEKAFEGCRGIAVLSVLKTGFLLSARGGSGLVIAKTSKGWSAPSAIGMGGIGGGFEIGAQISSFVFILRNDKAVGAFSKGGNVTLGGNLSAAAGPYGRTGEVDAAIRSTAAVFTYCKSAGAYVGVSLEGSGIMERKDANKDFYNMEGIRAKEILTGDVVPPKCEELDMLYAELNRLAPMSGQLHQARNQVERGASDLGTKFKGFGRGSESAAAGTAAAASTNKNASGSAAPSRPPAPNMGGSSSRTDTSPHSASGASRPIGAPVSFGRRGRETSPLPGTAAVEPPQPTAQKAYFSNDTDIGQRSPMAARMGQSNKTVDLSGMKTAAAGASAGGGSNWGTGTMHADPPPPYDYGYNSAGAVSTNDSVPVVAVVRADYDYTATESWQLSFNSGDVIDVLRQGSSNDDWWEGQLHGNRGLFPANYVQRV
eukprot:Clim_evm97s11 gene=Clim_evmTU97s11